MFQGVSAQEVWEVDRFKREVSNDNDPQCNGVSNRGLWPSDPKSVGVEEKGLKVDRVNIIEDKSWLLCLLTGPSTGVRVQLTRMNRAAKRYIFNTSWLNKLLGLEQSGFWAIRKKLNSFPIKQTYTCNTKPCHDVLNCHCFTPHFGKQSRKFVSSNSSTFVLKNKFMHHLFPLDLQWSEHTLSRCVVCGGSVKILTPSATANLITSGQKWLECPSNRRSNDRQTGA